MSGSRGLTAAFIAELASERFRPVIFVEAQFVSGFVRIFSKTGTLAWNGNTWSGVGGLLGISAISDTSEIKATAITISLSGIQSADVTRALDECRPNYPVTVWFGTLDIDGKTVVPDPTKSFDGLMDVPTVDQDSQSTTISISVETELAQLQRARIRRYTDQDQQAIYPGDKGFEYVTKIQDQEFTWGGKPVASRSGNGGTTCFSGNVRIRIPQGIIRLQNFIDGEDVITPFGPRPARLLRHEYNGPMLDMGEGELVTFEHEIHNGGADFRAENFTPAENIFNDVASFTGEVFDLQVITDVDQERCFLLANGYIPHNKNKANDRID